MRFKNEEKKMWLEDWQASGKNAWAYAKENGLCPQTFTKWTKVKTENESRLIEVPMKTSQPLQFPQEILIEKGDMKIHIPLSVGCSELRTVFTAMKDVI